MKKNPYTLVFGKEPTQVISRMAQSVQIVDAFLSDPSPQQIYMITGVRGAGKTVFMTEVVKAIKKENNWITVELNPEKDLLQGLAAKLSSEDRLAEIFQQARINLSFFGLGLEVAGTAPITDIETALIRMLTALQNHHKKVLITIDEVSSTPDMRVFAHSFQIFVRQDLPVYLLMTGLYENINTLQNEKTLTFLYRAPKIELTPLNTGAVARNYAGAFQLDHDDALEMARLTKGYPFAFQVLGYFTWEKEGEYKKAQEEYRQYLEEYVYEKIWSELSRVDRNILYGVARSQSGRIIEIRELLGIETNQINPYRKRLIRKGLLNGDERGYLRFTLPMFEYFVLDNYNG